MTTTSGKSATCRKHTYKQRSKRFLPFNSSQPLTKQGQAPAAAHQVSGSRREWPCMQPLFLNSKFLRMGSWACSASTDASGVLAHPYQLQGFKHSEYVMEEQASCKLFKFRRPGYFDFQVHCLFLSILRDVAPWPRTPAHSEPAAPMRSTTA